MHRQKALHEKVMAKRMAQNAHQPAAVDAPTPGGELYELPPDTTALNGSAAGTPTAAAAGFGDSFVPSSPLAAQCRSLVFANIRAIAAICSSKRGSRRCRLRRDAEREHRRSTCGHSRWTPACQISRALRVCRPGLLSKRERRRSARRAAFCRRRTS